MKLTKPQKAALLASEDTLYGDVKMVKTHGTVVASLAKKGLVEGEMPHAYLTEAGKDELKELLS